MPQLKPVNAFPYMASRRGFFTRAGRYCGCAALGVLVAFQNWKGRKLVNDPNCIKLITCADCIQFDGCRKDKAAQFRSSSRKA